MPPTIATTITLTFALLCCFHIMSVAAAAPSGGGGMAGFDMSAGDSYVRVLTKEHFAVDWRAEAGRPDATAIVAFLAPWHGFIPAHTSFSST